jgi:hypothetical protein
MGKSNFGLVYSNGVPVFPTANGVVTGNAWFVDSGSGSDTNPGDSVEVPFATIDKAVGKCTADNGDVIYVMPGHAETISTAAQIAVDVNGITIRGMGTGTARPTLTFSSLVTADIDISANSVKIENILFKAGVDNLTAPLHITGTDCFLENCEFQDTTSYEADIWILTTADADRLKLKGCFHNGDTATGNALTSFIRLIGVDDFKAEDCEFSGTYGTAVIEFHTTACKDAFISNCKFNVASTTDLSKNVVATIGSNTWVAIDCSDLGAGCKWFGGSGLSVEKDTAASIAGNTSDLTILVSDLTIIASDIAAASSSIETTQSNLKVTMSDVKSLLSDLTDYRSDIQTTQSDVKIICSDLKITLSALRNVASDVVVTVSDIKTAQSDIKLIDTVVDKTSSDLICVQSDLKSTLSDLKVADALIDTVKSDLIIVMSDLKSFFSDFKAYRTKIESDITIIMSDVA